MPRFRLSLKYTELIPVLTKAIQEQQAQIEVRRKESAELRANNKANLKLAGKVRELQQLIGITPQSCQCKSG